MHEPILSVILPCYNISQYIDRCIESIYAQNLNIPFEIIAIDDASTDTTLSELKRLESKHKEFKVIQHKVNKKLTGARTTGIQAASGKYIMHLDPDDYLLPQKLNQILTENGFDWDILITNIIVENPEGNYLRYNWRKSEFDMSVAGDRKMIFDKVVKGSCFGKIIRKDLLNDLNYFNYNYNMGEDRAFNAEVFSRARHIAYDERPLYFYALNPKSLIRSTFNTQIIDWNNCWVGNLYPLLKGGNISEECLHACCKEIERYSVGILLKIQKEKSVCQLYEKWQQYFSNHLELFGYKKHWYKTLLQIGNRHIAIPLLLASPLQWAPIKDRIKRIFH